MKKKIVYTWGVAAAIRALKTFAQAAVAQIPAAVLITEVDWVVVLGTALTAALLSILMSVAGLPEVDETTGEKKEEDKHE